MWKGTAIMPPGLKVHVPQVAVVDPSRPSEGFRLRGRNWRHYRQLLRTLEVHPSMTHDSRKINIFHHGPVAITARNARELPLTTNNI